MVKNCAWIWPRWGINFSIVAVSEIWLFPSTEGSFSIPRYDKIIKSREGKLGGELAFFLDNDLNIKCELRPDLEYSAIFESLFIQISQPLLKVKDIIIGVIYRPPGTNLERFYHCFFPIIGRISSENRPCYILGNFNIWNMEISISKTWKLMKIR